MHVAPRRRGGFAEGAAAVAVFPDAFSKFDFDRAPAAMQHFRNATTGTAVGGAVTAVRYSLPTGAHGFDVTYRAHVPAAGTSVNRFDVWSAQMPQAYAELCTGTTVPSICPSDRTASIAFAVSTSLPVGPGQGFDASIFLTGTTTSGIALEPGSVPGAVFTGDNPAVATVSPEGKVTGIAPGEVHVSATVGKLRTATPITVTVVATQVPVVTRLTVAGPATITTTEQYTAHGFTADGTEVPVLVAWTVTPAAGGAIDAAGRLTPLAAGPRCGSRRRPGTPPGLRSPAPCGCRRVPSTPTPITTASPAAPTGARSSPGFPRTTAACTAIRQCRSVAPTTGSKPGGGGTPTTTSTSTTSTTTTTTQPTPLPDLVVNSITWGRDAEGGRLRPVRDRDPERRTRGQPGREARDPPVPRRRAVDHAVVRQLPDGARGRRDAYAADECRPRRSHL